MFNILFAMLIAYGFWVAARKITKNSSKVMKHSIFLIGAIIFSIINCVLLYINPVFNIFIAYPYFKDMFMPPEEEKGQEGYGKKYHNAGKYALLLCIPFLIFCVLCRVYTSEFLGLKF